MNTPYLYDQFGRKHDYLRIAVTDACNFRCIYCMPSERALCKPSKEIMTTEEIVGIADTFVKAGIKKIRLTGGEPLVRKNFKQIINQLSALQVELAITTNGVLLDKFLYTFKQTGLRSINVSLDSLNPVTFYWVSKKNLFAKVMTNIYELLRHDFYVKLNIVVMKGVNDNEINEFVELTKRHPLHIRFIEYMPFLGNHWDRAKVISYKEIIQTISQRYPIEKLSDGKSDTAKKFHIPGYAGTFSTISSVSNPFCEGCNRLRLTSDGKMKNCLFSKDEIDLLTPYRNQEDLLPYIQKCVLGKAKERGGQQLNGGIEGRAMVKIGG
jgi:GTP 3',8-cyclase